MTSQKDKLYKVAQDFPLIDQCFPRDHQYTEAGVGLTMGWTITARYSPHDHQEYKDYHLVQHWNQSISQSRIIIQEKQLPVRTKTDVADKEKKEDDVFSGNQMAQDQNRRNSNQVLPAAAWTNKSNFSSNPGSNLPQATQGHGGPNSNQAPPTIRAKESVIKIEGGWYLCRVPQVPTGKGDVIKSGQAAKIYGGYLIGDY